MNVNEILSRRYSTKKFKEVELDKDTLDTVKNILRLAPSSSNTQPWKFIIATTKEGKEKIAKSASGIYAFNTPKILEASAVVVFLADTTITDEHLKSVLEKEDSDGRYSLEQYKLDMDKGRRGSVIDHRDNVKDEQAWTSKQAYLNVGYFVFGVAALGLDSVIMEGFDSKILDEEFDLAAKGLASQIVVPVGYKADDDFNAALPKSRLSEDELFINI